MKKRILVVDDSESIREIISMGLTTNGYEVIKGINGADGLEKLNGIARVDLIITDLNMPILDGISFLKELRKLINYRFSPVIILTTESQESKKREAREAGATAWIVKPFTNERLINVIKKII
jgi:two-component system, chemotaxis family, chemotaxis protein CheY